MPTTPAASTMIPLASSATTATAAVASCSSVPPSTSAVWRRRWGALRSLFDRGRQTLGSPPRYRRRSFPLRVLGESKGSEVSLDTKIERSESDKLVDGLEFGELCNDFECVSSPYVEATARQIVRDILELREGNRALGSYALAVKYKDPIRSFTGREKYKRPLWSTNALENASVTVQEMEMLSTNLLSIKWTIIGKPKNLIFGSIAGNLVIRVNSQFTMNQISGQVIEHEETWDLSSSSIIAQGYFWFSRSVYSAIQAGNDTVDAAKGLSTRFPTGKENTEVYPDPSGDPTKFFQREDEMRDAYQIALFLAVVYFVVQFLRTTL